MREELLADLEVIWHSVSDDAETNAAYARLKAALPAAPQAECALLYRLVMVSGVSGNKTIIGDFHDERTADLCGEHLQRLDLADHVEWERYEIHTIREAAPQAAGGGDAAVGYEVLLNGVWEHCSREEYESRKLACPHLRHNAQDFRALYTRPAPPVEAPAQGGQDDISRMLMDCADLLGAGEEADPRAWDHLLVYAPKAPTGDGEAVAYFAADPAQGDFEVVDSLAKARDKAQEMLDYASDDAADSGWADDAPQICYGVVVGQCVETSRVATPGADFDEIVEFALQATPAAARPGEVTEEVAADVLDRFNATAPSGHHWPPEDCRKRRIEAMRQAIANALIAASTQQGSAG
jgi:hypothetical protein